MVTHVAEPGHRDVVVVAHPHDTGALNVAVSLSNVYGMATGVRVEQAEHVVVGHGGEELASQGRSCMRTCIAGCPGLAQACVGRVAVHVERLAAHPRL